MVRRSGCQRGQQCVSRANCYFLPHKQLLNPDIAAGLGEARIRDLNDEINKCMREKIHWERQIKALGGPDYAATAPRIVDEDGREVPGSGGYRYFGAAKDLPGVRELFAAAVRDKARRNRGAIHKSITPDYYGYRDEEDGVLLARESVAEHALIAAAVEAWAVEDANRRQARAAGVGSGAAAIAAGVANDAEEEDDEAALAEEASALSSAAFKAHVPLPEQRAVEAALLEKKRARLIAKLALHSDP